MTERKKDGGKSQGASSHISPGILNFTYEIGMSGVNIGIVMLWYASSPVVLFSLVFIPSVENSSAQACR